MNRVLLLAFSLFGCSDAVIVQGWDEPPLAGEQGVVGGQSEPWGARYLPVGYLMVGQSRTTLAGPNCGATLIAPDIAITAAHCIRLSPAGSTFGVKIGSVFSAANPARAVVVHPSYVTAGAARYRHDVAVLFLERPITGITPATVGTASISGGYRYIGYGRTTPGGYDVRTGYTGERKSTGEQLTHADGYNLWTTGQGGGLCWGDSGGPLMDENGGNTIYGVLADFNGVFDCHVGNSMIFTSLSGELAFVNSALACTGAAHPETCMRYGPDAGAPDAGTTVDAGSCQFYCRDFGYAPGMCNQGWYCDGTCLTYNLCGMDAGVVDAGVVDAGVVDAGATADAGVCQYDCVAYGYLAGQCNQGWYCDGRCLQYTGCGRTCQFTCAAYGYRAGQCNQGWYCDGACVTYNGCR